MNVFIFASEAHRSVSAFTSDSSGANLPAEYAPWRAANGGRAVLAGSNAGPVAKAVERDGYFLLGSRARH
jgi:hypothetical protein